MLIQFYDTITIYFSHYRLLHIIVINYFHLTLAKTPFHFPRNIQSRFLCPGKRARHWQAGSRDPAGRTNHGAGFEVINYYLSVRRCIKESVPIYSQAFFWIAFLPLFVRDYYNYSIDFNLRSIGQLIHCCNCDFIILFIFAAWTISSVHFAENKQLKNSSPHT